MMIQQIIISTIFTRLSHRMMTVFHVGSPVLLQRIKLKSESLPFHYVPCETHSLYINYLLFVSRHGPCITQRQAPELTSDPSPAAKAWLLSFNRIQSRVVTGLTGHNTLRGHPHLMGLSDNPTCRKCGTEEKTSVHILCSFTQTCISGFLHFGLWGYYEPKYRGHLVW